MKRRIWIVAIGSALVVVVGVALIPQLVEGVLVSKSRRILANTWTANTAVVEHRRNTGRYPIAASAEELVTRVAGAKAATHWGCSYESDGIKYALRCPAYRGKYFLFAEDRLVSYPDYMYGRLSVDRTLTAPN